MKIPMIILIAVFVNFEFIAKAQIHFKPVKVHNKCSMPLNFNRQQDSQYHIYRLDTNQFKAILEQYPNLVVHFWKPWCHGAVYSLGNFLMYYDRFNFWKIPQILISDSRIDSLYFKLDTIENWIGIGTHHINQYNLQFNSYIMSSELDIVDYENIIFRFTNHKKSKKGSTYYIHRGKFMFRNFPFRFYKKYGEKILELNKKDKAKS